MIIASKAVKNDLHAFKEAARSLASWSELEFGTR